MLGKAIFLKKKKQNILDYFSSSLLLFLSLFSVFDISTNYW